MSTAESAAEVVIRYTLQDPTSHSVIAEPFAKLIADYEEGGLRPCAEHLGPSAGHLRPSIPFVPQIWRHLKHTPIKKKNFSVDIFGRGILSFLENAFLSLA